jgi:hypothetical protein
LRLIVLLIPFEHLKLFARFEFFDVLLLARFALLLDHLFQLIGGGPHRLRLNERGYEQS